jgi:hypothetical protein
MIAEAERQNRDFTAEGAEDTEMTEEGIGQTEWPKSQGGHEVVVVLRRKAWCG